MDTQSLRSDAGDVLHVHLFHSLQGCGKPVEPRCEGRDPGVDACHDVLNINVSTNCDIDVMFLWGLCALFNNGDLDCGVLDWRSLHYVGYPGPPEFGDLERWVLASVLGHLIWVYICNWHEQQLIGQ